MVRSTSEKGKSNGQTEPGGPALATTDETLPPHSIEAEIAFLGSLTICDDPAIIDDARQRVSRDEFYQADNQIIFDALLRMRDQDQSIDAVTLIAELTRAKVYEEIGGRDYIATILGSIPSHKHYESYARVIRETATRRKTIAACHDAIWKAYQPQAGQLVEEAAADAAALAEQLTKIAATAAPPTAFRATSAGQLVDENPEQRPEAIYGVSRFGDVLNIIAGSKARKSWLVLSLLLCFVARRVWLGLFATAGGRALLIDNELHPSTISFRIRRTARGLGLMPEEWRDAFDVMSLRGQGMNIDQLAPVIRSFPPGKYGLIVLDAGYKLYPPGMDENSNSDMTVFYDRLIEFARVTGAVVALIHHSPKGNQSAKDPTALGAGASAASRSTDSILAMRDHEEQDCCVIDTVLRDFPPLKPFGLRWSHDTLTWSHDQLLDPTKLKRDPAKGGRPKKADGEKPAKAEAIDWTPEKFVGEFITVTPISRTLIEATAASKGMSARQIRTCITLAEHQGLMFRHGAGPATTYSTAKPDLFTPDPGGPRPMRPKEADAAAKKTAKLFRGCFTKEECDLLARNFTTYTNAVVTDAVDELRSRHDTSSVVDVLKACEAKALSEKNSAVAISNAHPPSTPSKSVPDTTAHS